MTQETSKSNKELQDWINNNLSRITKDEVNSLIDEANLESTSEIRVKEIIKIFSDCIGVLLIPVAQHHFYRSRYWGNKENYPTELSQLLEPSPSKTKINRCNIEESPVLTSQIILEP